jgi:hypothetical protein
MAKIKYLGSADYAVLERGENFGGRLAEPLTKRVEFAATSGHLVDSEEAGLSPEAVALLLEDKERFKDVSDLSVIPTSLNEQIFRGLPKSQKDEQQPAQAGQGEQQPAQAGQGEDKPVVAEGGQSASGGAAGGAAGAAPGGSTTSTRSR